MWYDPNAWASAFNSVLITYYILNTIQPIIIILFIVLIFFLGGWGIRRFIAPVIIKGSKL